MSLAAAGIGVAAAGGGSVDCTGAGTLLDLVISEGPLVATVGALLAALGFGLQRRRRSKQER